MDRHPFPSVCKGVATPLPAAEREPEPAGFQLPETVRMLGEVYRAGQTVFTLTLPVSAPTKLQYCATCP